MFQHPVVDAKQRCHWYSYVNDVGYPDVGAVMFALNVAPFVEEGEISETSIPLGIVYAGLISVDVVLVAVVVSPALLVAVAITLRYFPRSAVTGV